MLTTVSPNALDRTKWESWNVEDKWSGISDFDQSIKYWVEVQESCIANGSADERSFPLLLGAYLDGERVVITTGPGNKPESEGNSSYSIGVKDGFFVLYQTGRQRGRRYVDVDKGWFSRSQDVFKYFIGSYVGEWTRLRATLALPPVSQQWLNRGLADGWASSDEPDPEGFSTATRFSRIATPQRCYFTNAGDTATSFLLNLSWTELNATYARGFPGVESISMPRFTDAGSDLR